MFRSALAVRSVAVIAVTVALGAACTGEPQADDPVNESTSRDDQAEREPALTGSELLVTTPAGVLGHGRAEQAHLLEGGGLVVVTTTGIDIVNSVDAPLRRIAEFDQPGTTGPTALTPDRARLIMATSAPNTITTFDLTSGAVLAHRASTSDIRAIIEREEDPPVLVTTSGLEVVHDDESGSAPITLLATETGQAAAVDERVIAPRRGTTSIDIVTADGAESFDLELPDGATVLDAAVAPGGAYAAVSSGVGAIEFDRVDSVTILESGTWAQQGTYSFGRALDPAEWAVTDGAFLVADGDGLSVTSIADGTTRSFPWPTGSQPQSIIPTPDGAITVHRSGELVVWDDAEWSSRIVSPGGLPLRDVRLDEQSRSVVAVDTDGGISTWDLESGVRQVETRFQRGAATSVAFDESGDAIAVGSTTGTVVVTDRDLAPVDEFAAAPPSTRVDDVAFNPATGQLVTALAERLGDIAFDDTVTIWDADRRAPEVSIGGESEDVPGCAFFYNRLGFTFDGTLLSTVSHDFSVTLHDPDGGVIERLPAFDSTVLDTAFSPDGKWIAASTDSAAVAVWDTSDFSVIAQYRGPPGGYASMGFLPDGRTVVASDLLGRIVRVDIVSGEELEVITDGAGSGAPVTVSPDGSLVAAPMRGSETGIWSTDGGPQLATLSGHRATVTDVEFSPDGQLLATASADGTARTWAIGAA